MKSLIKFKSMQEILLTDFGTFDEHGNLCVYGEHLAPTYFSHLGQLHEIKAGHSFPHWCIEKEYRDDAMPSNCALRILKTELEKTAEASFRDESLKEIVDHALEGKTTLVYKHSKPGAKDDKS